MSSPTTLTPVASNSLHGSHGNFNLQIFPESPNMKEKAYNIPRSGWRKVIYGFTPSWFSVTMGTGIVSILFFGIPYQGSWLYWLSVITFLLNVLIFAVFLVLTVLRYFVYPHLLRITLQDLGQSLFIGTFPMGLATIITMLAQIGRPVLGQSAVTAAWILWWIDAALSLACCFSAPFLIMNTHQKQLRHVTAAWLLPIIPTIVASATGAVIASLQEDPEHALWTITASYILWGAGIPLAFLVLFVYLIRLIVFKFPSKDNTVSIFFPLGPLGQGAFAIQRLGDAARTVFPQINTLNNTATGSGNILYIAGWIIATPLWGFAAFWLVMAVVHISYRRFPFNMGWWAFTFPLGTVAMATITLGADMPSAFFNVLGTIFAVAVILLWILCTVQTIHHAWSGDLFSIH